MVTAFVPCCMGVLPTCNLTFAYVFFHFNMTDPTFPACCERSDHEYDLHHHQSTFLHFHDKRLWTLVPCETDSYPCQFYSRNAHKHNHKHQLHELPSHVSSFLGAIKILLQMKMTILTKNSMRTFSFNCCSVSGLASVIQEMPLYRRQEITHGLLGYLRNAENAINEPGRADIGCVMCFPVWNVLKSTQTKNLNSFMSTSHKPC